MRNVLFIATALFCASAATAQPADKAKLERERQELQQQLKEIQQNYNKVKGYQKVTIGQLNILQSKMQVQNKYISNISGEIKNLSDDIYLSNQEITRLQRQLDTLKSEYARSVVYAYKNNNSYDYLNFIFSAASFNDALRRVAYLKSYRAYNEQKVKTISETQLLIQQRKQQLLGKTNQKKSALQNQQTQLGELEDQKKEKDQVVAKLKTQVKDLSQQIATKKKRDAYLRNQVAAIIRRDIERAQAEERKRIADLKKAEAEANKRNNTTTTSVTPKAPAKKQTAIVLNEGEAKLAASFQANQGRLPWPVDNGFVSIPFGRVTVDGLVMDNTDITISTPSAGTPVKAVFAGEVKGVYNTGEGYMVVIRHGKYYTAYTNLASAGVAQGDMVGNSQQIGKTGAADDGSGGQIGFTLMIETRAVNPRPWLR